MAKTKDSKEEKKIKRKPDMALIDLSIEIQSQSALVAKELGLNPYVFIKTILPHSEVEGQTYERENEGWKLFISSQDGIPYGSTPRLLFNYITTQAVKTNSREIDVGRSLSDFMRIVGLSTDGKTMERFKKQCNALFGSTLSITYKDGDGFTKRNLSIASLYEFWWESEEKKQLGLFSSKITLSKEFFDLIVEKHIPVDLRAIKGIKKSSLAIDVYSWLTYKYYRISKRSFIPWEALIFQFGAGYAENKTGRQSFKRSFQTALEKIQIVYPEAKFSVEKDGLVLFPSPPHISPKNNIKELK